MKVSKLNIIQNIIPVDISFCIKDRETIKNQDYRLFNELNGKCRNIYNQYKQVD